MIFSHSTPFSCLNYTIIVARTQGSDNFKFDMLAPRKKTGGRVSFTELGFHELSKFKVTCDKLLKIEVKIIIWEGLTGASGEPKVQWLYGSFTVSTTILKNSALDQNAQMTIWILPPGYQLHSGCPRLLRRGWVKSREQMSRYVMYMWQIKYRLLYSNLEISCWSERWSFWMYSSFSSFSKHRMSWTSTTSPSSTSSW